MSPEPSEYEGPSDPQIAALVNEYFDRRQSGEDLTPDQFAAEHPELAENLRPYLEGLSLIDQARSVVLDERLAAAPPGPLPHVAGYELHEEIGRGGMGVVYRALQVATKRIVAVKVMLAGPFASPTARRRFQREVELAARLDHPGVVRILESGTVAGQPYYAMDYVAGRRLDEHLAAAHPDVAAVLGLFIGLCDTVHTAHERGVVHRDLKPANVLVDAAGRPHILDFGLAKVIDQVNESTGARVTLSTPGQVVGTLAYLSPEQAAGMPGAVDGRTDVYALGVMLFEALTGRLPIDPHGRPSDVIQRILDVPPLPPARLSPRVDGELETILLKALEKQPERRYASATELADDLRRYLAREPILARRPSSLYVARKKLRKHRARIALGLAAVIVILASIWMGGRWTERAHEAGARRELDAGRREALRVAQLLDIGDIRAGRSGAEALAARYPDLAEAAVLSAKASYLDQDWAVAINRLERLPTDTAGYWVTRVLLSDIYRQSGDTTAAEPLAAAARHELADDAETWYLRSLGATDAGEAARCARAAVRRNPAHVLALGHLTRLAVVLADLDEADRTSAELRSLEPTEPHWWLLRAEILLRRGECERAVVLLKEAPHSEGGVEAAAAYLAIAYRRLERYADAVAEYDRILATARPGTVPIWHRYQRASPLWMLGRRDDAVRDYEAVRTILGSPHFADARRALLLFELGRDDEARTLLASVRQETTNPWLRRIFMCLAGDLPPEELVQAADATNPEQVCEAYYYAAEVALREGDRDHARRWFTEAVGTGVAWDRNSLTLVPMNEYELAGWRLESLAGPATRPNGG